MGRTFFGLAFSHKNQYTEASRKSIPQPCGNVSGWGHKSVKAPPADDRKTKESFQASEQI
jgi:hypothetical protein